MSNSIKKFVAGFSTLALAMSMFAFTPVTVDAASAGGVYKTTDGTVWFVTEGMQKRPFTSAGAFMSYGFLSFSQVMEADASVTGLPTGSFIAPQDGRIFCATETKATDVSGECSLITGGKKAAFTSSSVFTGQGYSFARAYYGDSSFLEKTSNIDNASAQHRPGTLINNNGTVQLVVTGGLWGVPSMDVFNSWGWSFADVVPANSADVLLSQTGVIPARMAGQLVPTATTGGGSTPSDCNVDGIAGDVTVSLDSEYQNEEVGEGEEEVPVLGFDVEADDDSDVAITSVKVELQQTVGTNSEDITDYIDEVVIMLGDEVVGSADAEDFSESADRYSKSITLDDCTIVDAGEESTFFVAITALESLDSADINDDAWDVELDSLRFEDGDGVTTTETPAADAIDQAFDFGTFAAVNDVELTVSLSEEGEDINEARVIDVDDTDDTDEVEMLEFTLEASGDSDIMVTEIPVLFTATEAAGDTFNDIDDIATTARLWMGSEELASESFVSTDGDDNVETITFEDLEIEIDQDDEVELTVTVDLQDTGTGLDEGDTLKAEITGTQTDLIEAEDETGEDVGTGDLEGTALGEAHIMYVSGIMVEFVDSSEMRTAIADAATESDTGEFKITFEVTAFDGDMRIDRTCESDNGVTAAGQGAVTDEIITAADTTGWGITCNLSSSSTDTEDNTLVFEVDEGTTRTFTVTSNITPDEDSYVQVILESINWGTAVDDTNANNYSFNMGDFKTDSIFLNDM